VVIQDIDRRPGLASFVGEIHARIMASLGCVGVITNGAVRDLGRLGDARFQMYSSTLSVSHAYAHIVDFGGEVEVAGLRIMPGDLLHGDRHGVIVVPPAIAQKIPEVIRRNEEQENRIVEYCGSQDFTLEGLRRRVSWRD
jgi:regulator of RNase E activity RraA